MTSLSECNFFVSWVFVVPPEYPETTSKTPLTFSNASSMHQKHPPAKYAVLIFCVWPIFDHIKNINVSKILKFMNRFVTVDYF